MSTTIDRPIERAPVNKATEWRFLGRSADFWLCGLLTFVVVFVQAWNIAGYPRVFDDEGTYLAQAWAIDHGIGMTPYTYWFDHPPLGWIQFAALAWIPALIFHGPAQLVVAYSRIIMLPFTAASCILMYVLARRLSLPRWAAALAVVAFGLSPLSITLQREIFLDNVSVTWILAAFVLVYSPRKHLWHHVAAGLCAGVSVLSKETMLLAVPALGLALWQNVHKDTRRYSYVGFSGAFILLIVQYPLYAALKGELWAAPGKVSLWAGITYQLTRPGSGSIFNKTSNAYSILHNWLYYDPIIIVAGTIALVLCLASSRLRPIALAGVILVLVAVRPTEYLPAMYVIQVLPFYALAIAGLADWLVRFLLTFRARPVFWQQITRIVLVAALAFAAAFYVVPRWYAGDKQADTQDLNTGYAEAVAWIATHIKHPGNARIVVDDTLWLNMVEDGFKPSMNDIYFFKLDVDPDVMKWMPGPEKDKWKDIQYVIETPYMFDNSAGEYTTYMVLNHSKVIWYYGSKNPNSVAGQNSDVEIRQVIP